jgi:hypothetical protein
VTLLTGVIAMMIARLNRSMASRAITNQVIKLVGLFPVTVKVSPRDNVVNIHRSTEFRFSNTTLLTGVAISFSGFVLLLAPIWATPFFVTALPVAMILAFLPIGCTFIRTKTPSVFITFYNVRSNFYGLTALLAGKLSVAALVSTFFGAGISTSFIPCKRRPKLLTADFTGFVKTCFLPFVGTLIRAESILPTLLIRELFAANFASLKRVTMILPVTLARTVFLRRAMRLKFLATNYTSWIRSLCHFVTK